MSPIQGMYEAGNTTFSAQFADAEALGHYMAHPVVAHNGSSSMAEDQADGTAAHGEQHHIDNSPSLSKGVPADNGEIHLDGYTNGEPPSENIPELTSQNAPALIGETNNVPNRHGASPIPPTTHGEAHAQSTGNEQTQIQAAPKAYISPAPTRSPFRRFFNSPLNARHRLYSFYPPENFSAVEPRAIYRSGFPQENNYAFIKTLKLKTILTLVVSDTERPHPASYPAFIAQEGIEHITLDLPANKDSVNITYKLISQALKTVTDTSKRPLLVHCNKGKHRTGCIVACFRRLQGCSMHDVIDEYVTMAQPKCRELDVECIKGFDIQRYAEDSSFQVTKEMDVNSDRNVDAGHESTGSRASTDTGNDIQEFRPEAVIEAMEAEF